MCFCRPICLVICRSLFVCQLSGCRLLDICLYLVFSGYLSSKSVVQAIAMSFQIMTALSNFQKLTCLVCVLTLPWTDTKAVVFAYALKD